MMVALILPLDLCLADVLYFLEIYIFVSFSIFPQSLIKKNSVVKEFPLYYHVVKCVIPQLPVCCVDINQWKMKVVEISINSILK